jgi:uncharacterized membrane protein YhaH (DUF805 family)
MLAQEQRADGVGRAHFLAIVYVTTIIMVITNCTLLIAVTVRRLNDLNLAPWKALSIIIPIIMTMCYLKYYLLLLIIGGMPVTNDIVVADSFVNIIVTIILLYIYCRKGTEGDNRFGPDPLQPK